MPRFPYRSSAKKGSKAKLKEPVYDDIIRHIIPKYFHAVGRIRFCHFAYDRYRVNRISATTATETGSRWLHGSQKSKRIGKVVVRRSEGILMSVTIVENALRVSAYVSSRVIARRRSDTRKR